MRALQHTLLAGLIRYGRRRYRSALGVALRRRRARDLEAMIRRGLPDEVVPALRYLVHERLDSDANEVASQIEALRRRVRSGRFKSIDIIYSPPPGSFAEGQRPQTGEVVKFSMARIAQTGKNQRWGTALHLLAREMQSQYILELGACAGISGAYLATAPHCKQLVTVEGSAPLAEIAQSTLGEVAPHAEVMNCLFDEALDSLLERPQTIDLAFIDGHHEKAATLHYFNRIQPRLSARAMVIFDDIAWSRDMADMWKEVSRLYGFSHTFNLGDIGVCIWTGEDEPVQWDFSKVL